MTLAGRVVTFESCVTTKRNGVTKTRPLSSLGGFVVAGCFVLLAVVPWLVGCVYLLFWMVRP